MKPQLLEKVIRDAAAMGVREIIPSTMGEPLLYPYFDTILDLCKALNLSLNLTTNGTFPAPESHQNVEYWAERIVPIGSDVKISWNGSNDKTQSHIMPGSSLTSHIENAKRFIAIRDKLSEQNYCSITMQVTFMKSNLELIPDMLALAIELGFDRLKGHQLWAHFTQIEHENLRNNILFAERWNQIAQYCHKQVAEHNRSAKRQFRLDNFFELDLNNLEDIAPGGECPFLGKELWVDPNGRLNVCCAPDKERQSLGYFGNVQNTSLQKLVSQQEYIALTNNYHERALCQSCTMRRPIESHS